MAVDTNPSRRPGKVRPARHMAPKGTKNTSRKESGGQSYSPGTPAATPSMNIRRGAKGSKVWKGPKGSSPGNPPSD